MALFTKKPDTEESQNDQNSQEDVSEKSEQPETTRTQQNDKSDDSTGGSSSKSSAKATSTPDRATSTKKAPRKKRAVSGTQHARAEKQLEKSVDTLADLVQRISGAIGTLRYAPGRKDEDADTPPVKPSEMDRILTQIGNNYRDGREAIVTLRRQEQAALTAGVQQVIAYTMQKSDGTPIDHDALTAARTLMEKGASAQEVLAALMKDA